jgi:hypothetical protein
LLTSPFLRTTRIALPGLWRYSNCVYLFGALVVLRSATRPPSAATPPSALWAADALFGGMLLALAALSTVCPPPNNAARPTEDGRDED